MKSAQDQMIDLGLMIALKKLSGASMLARRQRVEMSRRKKA